MEKVKLLNGKMGKFNEDTADSLGVYRFSNPSDFRYVREEIFKTESGRFVMSFSGGPLSKYAISIGRESSGNSGNFEITRQATIDWLNEHQIIESLEIYFKDEVEEI